MVAAAIDDGAASIGKRDGADARPATGRCLRLHRRGQGEGRGHQRGGQTSRQVVKGGGGGGKCLMMVSSRSRVKPALTLSDVRSESKGVSLLVVGQFEMFGIFRRPSASRSAEPVALLNAADLLSPFVDARTALAAHEQEVGAALMRVLGAVPFWNKGLHHQLAGPLVGIVADWRLDQIWAPALGRTSMMCVPSAPGGKAQKVTSRQ